MAFLVIMQLTATARTRTLKADGSCEPCRSMVSPSKIFELHFLIIFFDYIITCQQSLYFLPQKCNDSIYNNTIMKHEIIQRNY